MIIVWNEEANKKRKYKNVNINIVNGEMCNHREDTNSISICKKFHHVNILEAF